jgi:hypothetical protein
VSVRVRIDSNRGEEDIASVVAEPMRVGADKGSVILHRVRWGSSLTNSTILSSYVPIVSIYKSDSSCLRGITETNCSATPNLLKFTVVGTYPGFGSCKGMQGRDCRSALAKRRV